jgi:hypothetical protein
MGLRRLPCWDCGFEYRQGYGCLVSAVCCHAEVSASGRSLGQRSSNDSVSVCVSECHRETSIMRRTWPNSGYFVIKSWFRWSCGRRGRSAAPWLLGLRVRIPLRVCMSVFCVLDVVCVCVWERERERERKKEREIYKPKKIRRPRPKLGCCAKYK